MVENDGLNKCLFYDEVCLRRTFVQKECVKENLGPRSYQDRNFIPFQCNWMFVSMIFQFNIKLIQSKTWFFQFSQLPCWMGAKIQIPLHYRILTPIPPSFMKSLGLYFLNKIRLNQFSKEFVFIYHIKYIELYCSMGFIRFKKKK